jgi:hypothetical protein
MVKTEKITDIKERCYQAGLKNGWATGRYAIADGDFISEDDRLNRRNISIVQSVPALKHFFRHGNWCLGTGIIYENLFFLQQIDGGDEWATYRITPDEIFQFESITWEGHIKRGEFEKVILALTKATPGQCKSLTYMEAVA